MAQPRFSWRSHFHFALFCLSNWIRNFLIFLLKSRQMMLSPVKCLAEWLNGQLGTDGKLNAIVLAGFIQNPRRWMRGIGRYQNQHVQILGLFAQRLAFAREGVDELGISMVAFHDFFEHLTVLTIANRDADLLTMQIQFELLLNQIVKGMILLSTIFRPNICLHFFHLGNMNMNIILTIKWKMSGTVLYPVKVTLKKIKN